MNNFFSNLVSLLINGKYFILEKVKDEKEKDILSFSILIGFLIGAFHVISIFLLVEVEITLFLFLVLSFIGSIFYLSYIFAKSSIYYYLLGMYKEKLIGAGDIYKINLLIAYPFLLLPAFALISKSLDSIALFILFYLICFIISFRIKYKIFKEIIKINQFFYKLTYIIPSLVLCIVFFLILTFILVGNILAIKSFVESIINNILQVIKSI